MELKNYDFHDFHIFSNLITFFDDFGKSLSGISPSIKFIDRLRNFLQATSRHKLPESVIKSAIERMEYIVVLTTSP